MTIPNLITTLRIILVPIFVIYLMNDELLSALTVFILAGVSDGVDGLVARIFNQKSRLGAYLDPMADKILLVAAFIILAVRQFIPGWLTVIVITRDVLILLGVVFLFLHNDEIRIQPSILSKINTCFQLGTVFVVLAKANLTVLSHLTPWIYWLTAILTIASGLAYIRAWFQMVSERTESG
ncbi:MAG: CDP-diacylglycerol--glycerol-3-phosphate 3-phosphatidyltransferase [Deltaproteobacteria bacterium]|jgi:cardiolipin synthase (CMP-forming)